MNMKIEGYHIKLGTTENSTEIIELINAIQPNDPWTYEHFVWQYFGCKKTKSLLYLLYDGDTLIALYVAVGKNILFDGKTRKGAMIQDVMTHPDYRGKGILHSLSALCTKQMLEDGYVCYTFPNKKSENSFRRNGWTELLKVPLRTLNVKTIKSQDVKDNFTSTDIFDERVGEIWQKSGIESGVVRDSTFLNWRYSEKPNTVYLKYYIAENNGFLVLKFYNGDDKKVLHLLDLVVREDSINYISNTLDFVKQIAVNNSVDIITCWLAKGHKYSEQFENCGFYVDQNHDRCIFVLANEDEINSLSETGNFYISQGDSDVY